MTTHNPCGAGGVTVRHIAPRNPHPRRRVRHKHATRTIEHIHLVFKRSFDQHDRWSQDVPKDWDDDGSAANDRALARAEDGY